LTSLGWMSWGIDAQAQRDDETCPGKTTTNNCAGWKVTIATTSKASNFTVGAMAPEQALDRTVKPLPHRCGLRAHHLPESVHRVTGSVAFFGSQNR
jgi:hypothetical protein